ncbi:hypothetical protein [Rhizobium leguminosarum]
MLSKEGGNCRDLSIGQKLYNLSLLKITYDGAIAVIAAESLIVDADDA